MEGREQAFASKEGFPFYLLKSWTYIKASDRHCLANLDIECSTVLQQQPICPGPSDDSADSVPPPGTPGREETVTPSANKGQRLGTRTEASKSEAYDEVYEQANTLLKNLHFEWLHRKASV